MFSLLLLHATLAATGVVLAGLLRLPTRILRWSSAIGGASTQLLVSVQILSLFDRLHASELLWVNICLSAVAVCFGFYFRRKRPHSGAEPTLGFRDFLAEIGRANLILAATTLVAAGVLTVVARAVFPANDPYHVSMCLFWAQNGSVAAFPVYDPRIVGVVFASEAMALPGFLYARSPILFVLHSAFAAGLCTWAVYALARVIGGSRKCSFTAALAFAASSPLLTAIWGVKSDFLFSTFWLLVSLLCVFQVSVHPSRAALLLGCSSFAFAMGCGAKNTIVLHAPAYFVFLLLLLKRDLFRPRRLASIAAAGVFGALASGMVWSYAQNHYWFRDWRGHPYLKATLAEDYDLQSVWTRLSRSFVTLAYDVGWLPNSMQPAFAKVTDHSIRLLGGASTLAEDDDFYEMDLATFKPGAGMGLIGPMVLIPSLGVAIWCAARKRADTGPSNGAQLRALLIFAIISFLVFYAILRTQKIGVIRLMLSCVAVAMPLVFLIVRIRIGTWVAFAAAVLSLTLNLAHGLSFVAYRHQIAWLVKLAAVKRTAGSVILIQQGQDPPADLLVREPYTNRELYGMALPRVPAGATVGIIGDYLSEGFFSFGNEYSNTVIPMNDSRSATVIRPPQEVDFIFIEHRDVNAIDPSVFEDFTKVLEATSKGRTLFAFFERTSRL